MDEKSRNSIPLQSMERKKSWPLRGACLLVACLLWLWSGSSQVKQRIWSLDSCKHSSPFGKFPQPGDPFRFQPCTNLTVPPPLDDKNAAKTWASKFDPNPETWSWGSSTTDTSHKDEFSGRGIYLCGYLDAPLDYRNESDTRFVRLAVTKFQVSGLTKPAAIPKRKRTLIIEPGGPGGSGTSFVWRKAEQISQRFSNGKLDVLGWDPRGVNTSQPAISCFPYDADRDRWSLSTARALRTVHDPMAHLRVADAYNEAVFASCKESHGDLPRFMTTAIVARDLDLIRENLEEPDLSGYFVSYGTGIGQTYANMFPARVGRLILDGTEYVPDEWKLGGFGWAALDNATDAWNDGFLGECVDAGPSACALANAQGHKKATLPDLKHRMSELLQSISYKPLPAYTKASGPSLVTYTSLVGLIYSAMYSPMSWPKLATALRDLEDGNATTIAEMLDRSLWEFDPTASARRSRRRPSSDELTPIVVCGDSYDAPQPPFEGEEGDGLEWWNSLWHNMTAQNWIAGDDRFFSVLPCRHFPRYFGDAAEVYRGPLNKTLANPILLIAETYDPATPLRNGRRLLADMGSNARLIVHHGYGHSSQDLSTCTDETAKAYILNGKIPSTKETECFADEKPYRYSDAVQVNALQGMW